jgi:REP element-mobilizing transposase RayT
MCDKPGTYADLERTDDQRASSRSRAFGGAAAPGALHHLIMRGIKRRKIFLDDQDRHGFLERIGGIVEHTGTICYAWALITNHIFCYGRVMPPSPA